MFVRTMALLRRYSVLKIYNHQRNFSVLCKTENLSPKTNIICPIIHSTRYLFWERHRKGGYNTTERISNWEHLKKGFKELKQECKLFAQEAKELFESDPILIARPGEIDVLWCFDKPEALNQFVTTSDSDHNEGYSTCKLEMNSAGRGLFHGYLDTRVPKDGRIKNAGYAAMRSIRLRKSFKRAATYDWHIYNTLVLKVRGDGRSYLLNISCEGYHDITWNDIYHYVLYTRGGPYWQMVKVDPRCNVDRKQYGDSRSYLLNISCEGYHDITRKDIYHYVLYTRGGPYWQMVKIPFSKFVMGSKGRLQDKQNRFRFDRVTHFGISCGDKIDGRFNLEIEYIGLEFDPTHEEEFAYEMYKTDKFIVGV